MQEKNVPSVNNSISLFHCTSVNCILDVKRLEEFMPAFSGDVPLLRVEFTTIQHQKFLIVPRCVFSIQDQPHELRQASLPIEKTELLYLDAVPP